MSDSSAILSLPYLLPAQAQKHVTHNEALRQLDLLVQLSVTDRSLAMPPASPNAGDRYIVAPGGSGDWAGQDGAIALYAGAEGWLFTPPLPGWRAWVTAEAAMSVYDGSVWASLTPDLDNLDGVGIGTTADGVNRFAVSSEASLLSHAGAGHQLKVNKAGLGDTASLLFQTNWSGRAEMGTSGHDDFAIKVSADGAAWTTALQFDAATGAVSGDAVQQGPADVTPGRVALAQHAYGPGNLLGTVTQSGGVPTGAVIERGSNADGAFVRFADGTQICTWAAPGITATSALGALFRSGADQFWSFPAAFAAEPALSGHVDGGSSWVVFGASNLTSGAYRRYAAVSDGSSRALRLMAVGRWI